MSVPAVVHGEDAEAGIRERPVLAHPVQRARRHPSVQEQQHRPAAAGVADEDLATVADGDDAAARQRDRGDGRAGRRGRAPALEAAHAAPLPRRSSRWLRSSASSIFECIAPISSRSGSAPGGDDLRRAVGVDLAGQALEQHAHLLLDQRLERLAVAQRVVDREADRLVVAPGAEAADGLDDLHVVCVVAAAGRRSTPELGEAVQDVLGDLVAPARLGGGHSGGPRAGDRALEDPVLQLDERLDALGVVLQHALDQLQRHEALLLEALDHPDAIHEVWRVVGHVARRADGLGQQALAQVVLDRARADAGALGELGHLQQLASSQERPLHAGGRARDRARLLQRGDLLVAVAGAAQHLVGVLAERRTGQRGPRRRACGRT